jgi:transcriptional regulator with XRE-family HTH domain
MEIFSRRLKWLRGLKLISPKDMAKKLDMSYSGYMKIEYNQRDPKLETLVQISKILEESIDFLLGVIDYTKSMERISIQIEQIKEDIKKSQTLLGELLMEQYISVNNVPKMKSIEQKIEKLKLDIVHKQEFYKTRVHLFVDWFITIPMAQPIKDKFIKDMMPFTIDYGQDLNDKKWYIQLYDKNDEPVGTSIETEYRNVETEIEYLKNMFQINSDN